MFSDNDTKAMPPQMNGDNVMRLELDMTIDFKNYERIKKVWGEEIVLTRSKYYTCKLLVVEAGYTCSHHKHLVKNETFICVKGHGSIRIGDHDANVMPGDQLEVYVGVLHSFRTAAGMVLMEISTFDDADDSYRETQSRKM
jgi:mannose-6-phosphate isomerase-like protein (cupin superfamily)